MFELSFLSSVHLNLLRIMKILPDFWYEFYIFVPLPCLYHTWVCFFVHWNLEWILKFLLLVVVIISYFFTLFVPNWFCFCAMKSGINYYLIFCTNFHISYFFSICITIGFVCEIEFGINYKIITRFFIWISYFIVLRTTRDNSFQTNERFVSIIIY